jgi:6-phosphofructokinase 1
MVAFTRETRDGAYHCGITYQPLSICANAEKKIPREWINEDGTFVTQEFIDYVLPLIQGDNRRKQQNSLPRFAKLKKVKAEK